jgi:hypothetical protein
MVRALLRSRLCQQIPTPYLHEMAALGAFDDEGMQCSRWE